MPGRDRTGPRGLGPMTGRGAGYCSGQDVQGDETRLHGFGRRFGGRFCGRGGAHGWRYQFYATGLPFWARTGAASPTSDDVLAELKEAVVELKRDLEAISRRIEESEQK